VEVEEEKEEEEEEQEKEEVLPCSEWLRAWYSKRNVEVPYLRLMI
jgi:hypothetical protein